MARSPSTAELLPVPLSQFMNEALRGPQRRGRAIPVRGTTTSVEIAIGPVLYAPRCWPPPSGWPTHWGSRAGGTISPSRMCMTRSA
jgi:hypothetical protein